LSRDQRLGVRGEAKPHAYNPLARLAAMPMRRLDFWAEGKSLLRDVSQVARSGSDHVDGVAIRQLLGKSEVLNMDEKVGMENAVALFLVRRDADKMDLARCPTASFYGLPKVRDLSGNISLPLLICRTAPIGLDRDKGIQ
jgi:hypothetical protein